VWLLDKYYKVNSTKLNKNIEKLQNVVIADLDELECTFVNTKLDDQNRRYLVDDDIKFYKMFISESKYDDYMCEYKKKCGSECQCCDFSGCFCQSLCPKGCRCFINEDANRNIVDCSNLNLTDSFESFVETATELRLSGNRIEELRASMLFGYTQLRILSLDNNRIKQIRNDAFKSMRSSLVYLDLSRNDLKTVNWQAFKDLSKLNVLNLKENLIENITDFTCDHNNSESNLRISV
jgi:isocitrate lyase